MTLSKFFARLSAALASVLLAMSAQAQAPDAAQPATPTVPDQVAKAFRMADFAELERLYALYGQPGVRSPQTGTERVRHFWMGIHQVGDSSLNVSEGYFLQLDALTKKWATDYPQSVLAQLLYAASLIDHAWFFRGNDYANSVSPAAWEGFGKYLKLALDHLLRSEMLAAKDSSWNHRMMIVGRGLGWDTARLRQVFENGIAKNPDHDQLYREMQTTLLPNWGGDLPSVERFIAWATQRTRDTRGLEMYAQLYADLSYSQVKQSLFTATRVSWPDMKTGFEDRLKRFPHVDHRNMYAYFACMAMDKQALQEQLALIGENFQRGFWGDRPQRTFEECKVMAQQL